MTAYTNLPRTLVKSRIVAMDGGISPTMNTFGATSPGMSIWSISTMTIKNEIKSVTPKNSAAPIMNPSSRRFIPAVVDTQLYENNINIHVRRYCPH
jgi:hypothetical protein